MSFEGFVQKLCVNGHYWEEDVYGESLTGQCPQCDEEAIWENLVDTTNGSFCDCERGLFEDTGVEGNPNSKGCENCINGRIDGYVELKVDKPRVTKKCECCGAISIVQQETYKIPKKEK